MGCAAHPSHREKKMNTVAQIEQSKTAVAADMTSGKRERSEKSSSDEKGRSVKKRMGSRELKNHLKYIVPEIRLALIREPGVKALALRGAEDLDQFIEPLKHYSEEHFVSFHLNAKLEVIGYQIVSRGTLSASLVHPREVFKAALLANSYALIVAHNHPAGSLNPSKEDIETTKTLIKAGELLGVQVIDHVIVSHNGSQSIRESHVELWI
jgi:DNA repair protein RadC